MMIHRILIIQTAFLGDVILCTPLIKASRKLFPNSFISFLLIPETKKLLENNPHLNEIIVYDKRGEDRGVKNFLKMVKKIKRGNFDLALIPHRYLRSALLAYLAKIPQRIGFDKSSGSFLFTQKVTYQNNSHEVERNLSLLKPFSSDLPIQREEISLPTPHPIPPTDFTSLNLPQGEKGLPKFPPPSMGGGKGEGDLLNWLNSFAIDRTPELFPSSEDFSYAQGLLRDSGVKDNDKIVGIAPGSIWTTKRWIPERFAEVSDLLIKETSAKVIFLGSKEDEKLCLEIANLMENKPVILAGKTNILQSAAIISKCKVILSGDSAPVHIASAVKTPVVAIFGSTIPEFGFAPYGEGHLIIEKKMDCRPCGIHGKDKCPKKHFKCMTEITTSEVFAALLTKLGLQE
jgi:heptosyltransferase-2